MDDESKISKQNSIKNENPTEHDMNKSNNEGEINKSSRSYSINKPVEEKEKSTRSIINNSQLMSPPSETKQYMEGPKLSQNAQKLKDLELRMNSIEVILLYINYRAICLS